MIQMIQILESHEDNSWGFLDLLASFEFELSGDPMATTMSITNVSTSSNTPGELVLHEISIDFIYCPRFKDVTCQRYDGSLINVTSQLNKSQ